MGGLDEGKGLLAWLVSCYFHQLWCQLCSFFSVSGDGASHLEILGLCDFFLFFFDKDENIFNAFTEHPADRA